MKVSKLILSTAAIFVTAGAMGIASAQSTNNTPSPAVNPPMPSTTQQTDANRDAQQRARSTTGQTDARTNVLPVNTTDTSGTGAINNNTSQSLDNTTNANRNTNTNGRINRTTGTADMNDTTGMANERAPRADRN